MIQYKYFRFTDVFDYDRGTRYKREDHVPGEIAYISSSSKNNGLDAYVTPGDDMTVYQNKLTLANSGSVGCCFYHPYEFVASDHVMVIWIRDIEINENIALFLRPIFEKIKFRCSLGREINKNRLENEILYLPVDESGDPNWSYMNSYIDELKVKIEFTQIVTAEKNEYELKDKKWKVFKLSDVFDDIEPTKGTTTYDLTEGDEIPYIGAKKKDNGYVKMVALEGNEEYISKGNCIVFIHLGDGSGGYSTYQPNDFIGMNGKTSCGYSNNLNKYNALFLITMLDRERYKYSFGRGWTGKRFSKSEIYLPHDASGKPDWAFMEDYVKSLPYAENLG